MKHKFKILCPCKICTATPETAQEVYHRLENVTWNCQNMSGICGIILLCQISFYIACFGWFRNFSKFTLLLSNLLGSPFEFVTHKRSCQYVCRKNGKTYFGIVSGFDIWCGLTHKVVNVCLVVTICHLVFCLALLFDIPLRVLTYKLYSRFVFAHSHNC